jgi:ribonuclease HII
VRILGADEAGRGCVMGPLVVAGVLVDENGLRDLVELGVKDSKLLSKARREELAGGIRQIALDTHVIKISPTEIDKVVESRRRLHKLNRLEAQTMAQIIEKLRPDVAIVDAPDVVTTRYRNHILECLSFSPQVVSEHKADRNHPVVSAASIMAKVTRDQEVEKLRAENGDFGSGYMSDPKTKEFLESLAAKRSEYPHFVRRSWKPAKTAKADVRRKQTRLA